MLECPMKERTCYKTQCTSKTLKKKWRNDYKSRRKWQLVETVLNSGQKSPISNCLVFIQVIMTLMCNKQLKRGVDNKRKGKSWSLTVNKIILSIQISTI